MHNAPPSWTAQVSLLGFVSAETVAIWSAWAGLIMSVLVSIWTAICIAGWAWSKLRKMRGVPPGAVNLLALALLAPLLFGCASTPHQSAPVNGAIYTLDVFADGSTSESLVQGENAKTPTRFKRLPTGEVWLTMGTAFAPVITVPPVPDYAHYWVAGAGVVAMLGSGGLFYIGWPRVGRTVLLTGAVVLVIGLTVQEYGLLWAIAALVGGIVLVWHQLDGFEKGKLEGGAAA